MFHRMFICHDTAAGFQTMLSDIVVCGPASMCLAKPAVLSLSHCADSIDHSWSLTVIYRPLQSSDVTDTWRVCRVLAFTFTFARKFVA